jgi:hypothetical protein
MSVSGVLYWYYKPDSCLERLVLAVVDFDHKWLTLPAAPLVTVPPKPRASEEIVGFISWQKVFDGDDCALWLPGGLTMDVFFKMNPSVGKDCAGMNLSTHYCISTKELGIFTLLVGDLSLIPTSSRVSIGSSTLTLI